MKKSIKYLLAVIPVASVIALSGCSSERKALAKNLDNTVTNLVYTVSGLDWADSSTLGAINNPLNLRDNTYNFSGEENSKNIPEIQGDENLDFEQDEPHIEHHHHHMPHHRRNSREEMQQLRQRYLQENGYKMDEEEFQRLDPRQSGSKNPRKKINGKLISNLDDNYNRQNVREARTPRRQNPEYSYRESRVNREIAREKELKNNKAETNTSNSKKLVNFSTDDIENSKEQIQNIVSELINKRSNLLLYINDLYKGNIALSSGSKSAINAYMNIIKDNTAFLNQNKGIVSNQLNKAQELLSSDPNSSLAGAYIIRTKEAISSRIAKLESSISAMQSITEILKGSLKSSSPNFNKNDIPNNLDNNSNIDNAQIPQIDNQDNIPNIDINRDRVDPRDQDMDFDGNKSPIQPLPIEKPNNPSWQTLDNEREAEQREILKPSQKKLNLGLEDIKSTKSLEESWPNFNEGMKDDLDNNAPIFNPEDKQDEMQSDPYFASHKLPQSKATESLEIELEATAEKESDKKEENEKKRENNIDEKNRENQKELSDKASGKEVPLKQIDEEGLETEEIEFEDHMEANSAIETFLSSFIEDKHKHNKTDLKTMNHGTLEKVFKTDKCC